MPEFVEDIMYFLILWVLILVLRVLADATDANVGEPPLFRLLLRGIVLLGLSSRSLPVEENFLGFLTLLFFSILWTKFWTLLSVRGGVLFLDVTSSLCTLTYQGSDLLDGGSDVGAGVEGVGALGDE